MPPASAPPSRWLRHTPFGFAQGRLRGAAGPVSERLPGSSKSLWYHFGPQGETRQLTNSSGTVVDTYIYTAYGVPVSSTGSDANPFRDRDDPRVPRGTRHDEGLDTCL